MKTATGPTLPPELRKVVTGHLARALAAAWARKCAGERDDRDDDDRGGVDRGAAGGSGKSPAAA